MGLYPQSHEALTSSFYPPSSPSPLSLDERYHDLFSNIPNVHDSPPISPSSHLFLLSLVRHPEPKLALLPNLHSFHWTFWIAFHQRSLEAVERRPLGSKRLTSLRPSSSLEFVQGKANKSRILTIQGSQCEAGILCGLSSPHS